MIYALEFDKYWESKEYHTDAHSALLSVYDIFRRRKIPCFLLYRYKLPNLFYDWVNPREIKTKFGTSDPDKIELSKIYSKYVILYHVDTFEKNTDKLIEFFTYCQERQIEVFMPIKKDFQNLFKPEYWKKIESIVKQFDHHIFSVKQVEDEFRFQRIIERDLNLNDLLD